MNQKISQTDWKKRQRRSFLIAGISVLTGGLSYWWAQNLKQEEGVPWIFRRVLDFNAKIWKLNAKHPALGDNPPAPSKGSEARINSDIGIEQTLDLNSWRLLVSANAETNDISDSKNLKISIEQLQTLPQVEYTEVFKCVEGWSQTISYKGVRFSDFMSAYKIGTKDKSVFSKDTSDDQLYPFVGLTTPDENYYVSIDIESMLHPKTVLATEMNGVPISSLHGAPLRLVIPVKYGIKNLKRVGFIFFADEKPADYWTEQGYDWYAAL